MSDLLDQIEQQSVECLNERPDHTVAHALKQGYREDDGLFLQSDEDDPQLLINIPFQNKCKLQTLVIKGPADTGPKVIKLWANRPSMGFSDVNTPCIQEFSLTADQVAAGAQLTLKLVKFNSVNILTILIDSNQSDSDTSTTVQKIMLLGSAGEVFNVADIKKVDEHEH